MADTDLNDQIDIQPVMPLITLDDGEEGYELDAMIHIALYMYKLDPNFVQVDIWDNSLQTLIISNDLYAIERNSDNSNIRIIKEEQLYEDSEENLSLILRFKNCTGNIINLNKPGNISQFDQVIAHFPFSIDEDFKN